MPMQSQQSHDRKKKVPNSETIMSYNDTKLFARRKALRTNLEGISYHKGNDEGHALFLSVCIMLNRRQNFSTSSTTSKKELSNKIAKMVASNFASKYESEYEYFHNANSSNESIDDSTITDMDYSSSLSTKEQEATRLLEESRALWKFAKIFGVASVLLIITVFGFDPTIFEEIATLLVQNVVAAAILIFGRNTFTLIRDVMRKPLPRIPSEQSNAPLQGLLRASTRASSFNARCNKRPTSIIMPPKKSKGSSGGLFSGLWPKSTRKRSPKHSKLPKKVTSHRRGWTSDRLSSPGSI